PEWRGVLCMYLCGKRFWAIFFSIFSGMLISILPFNPLVFAMATGVGSVVMTAAALGPVVDMYLDLASTITEYYSVSNLLTSVTGLYVGILIALPLTRKYYSFIMHIKSKFTKDKEQ